MFPRALGALGSGCFVERVVGPVHQRVLAEHGRHARLVTSNRGEFVVFVIHDSCDDGGVTLVET